MSTEELAARMDAAFVKKEREHRFAAALWLLRRNPTLKRTQRAIRSHVARATAYGAPRGDHFAARVHVHNGQDRRKRTQTNHPPHLDPC